MLGKSVTETDILFIENQLSLTQVSVGVCLLHREQEILPFFFFGNGINQTKIMESSFEFLL